METNNSMNPTIWRDRSSASTQRHRVNDLVKSVRSLYVESKKNLLELSSLLEITPADPQERKKHISGIKLCLCNANTRMQNYHAACGITLTELKELKDQLLPVVDGIGFSDDNHDYVTDSHKFVEDFSSGGDGGIEESEFEEHIFNRLDRVYKGDQISTAEESIKSELTRLDGHFSKRQQAALAKIQQLESSLQP